MSAQIRWRLTKPVSRPVPASPGGGPGPEPRPGPVRNRLASPAFFSVVAAAPLVWGAVTMGQAPRWWLALGAAGNLVVVAT
jgi:hypothetical protein